MNSSSNGGAASSSSFYPSPSGAHSSSNSPFATSAPEVEAGDSVALVPKQEQDVKEETLYEVNDDDDDSDIEEIYAIENNAKDQSNLNLLDDSNSAVLPHHSRAVEGSSKGGKAAKRQSLEPSPGKAGLRCLSMFSGKSNYLETLVTWRH